MKETLLNLFLETLEEASLDRVMASQVRRVGATLYARDTGVDVDDPERIFVAGIGKAARPMCDALAPLLGARKTSFAIVAPESPGFERAGPSPCRHWDGEAPPARSAPPAPGPPVWPATALPTPRSAPAAPTPG